MLGEAPAPGLSTFQAAAPGGDYNRLPYPSMPFPHTQPAHLGAVAALFGLPFTPADCARVLELGCAAGGNIIPLAARFPQASFVGIDLSCRQVGDGRRRIAALGLSNIRLIQADLATLDLGGAQFDYIICNGVFSWVPEASQAAIFRLCRQALAPEGVVTISYNVLPGWHLRRVIRDLCLEYAGAGDSPQERVARARAALDQIAEAAPAAGAYGLLLRTEARRMKDVPSAYVMGEFLAADNRPCHVRDFIDRAFGYGLHYLCEADLRDPVPQSRGGSVEDRGTIEQRIDFTTGRPFRRSVLVRCEAGARAQGPHRQHLPGLHISSPVRVDAARSTPGTIVFSDERGQPITVKDAGIGASIERLGRAYPGTLTMADLAAPPDQGGDPAGEGRIGGALLAMVLAGRAGLSALPLRVGRAADERPRVWAVARLEAASGQPWITSMRHVGIPVSPVLKRLVPHMDGTNDRRALRSLLLDAWRGGRVELAELDRDRPEPAPAALDAIAGAYVEAALGQLERQAFLVHGPAR